MSRSKPARILTQSTIGFHCRAVALRSCLHGRGVHENGCRPDGSSSNPYRSIEGGSVAEVLDVTIERPALDQLQVEVGRTLEDRVQPGLTGDDRAEPHLHTVDGGLRGGACA